jgi:hypothetical protein
MNSLHPVPPDLSCVPACLVAITGLRPGVVESLMSRYRDDGWVTYDDTGRVSLACGETMIPAILIDLGYRIAESETRKPVREWAALSRRVGRPFVLLATDAQDRNHAMIVADGLAFDNIAFGLPAAQHPFADAISDQAFQWKNPTYASRGKALDRLKRDTRRTP